MSLSGQEALLRWVQVRREEHPPYRQLTPWQYNAGGYPGTGAIPNFRVCSGWPRRAVCG